MRSVVQIVMEYIGGGTIAKMLSNQSPMHLQVHAFTCCTNNCHSSPDVTVVFKAADRSVVVSALSWSGSQ